MRLITLALTYEEKTMDRFNSTPLRNKLKATAISSIWHSHSHAFRSSKKPYEPDHVASFIINGLPKLTELWSEWLTKYGLSIQITGVFCHQYPQVEFHMNGEFKTVELADLLIVRRHHSNGKIEKEVATLIQSKMSKDSTKSISPNDPQFFLYKYWPEFKFKERLYSNHQRNIGLIEEQSKYSLICEDQHYPEDNHVWPDSCFWSIVDDLKPRMESDSSFASFLEEIVVFKRGREFFSEKETGCEWTKTICELLDVTFNKKLKTRIFSAPKRGKDAYMSFVKGENKDQATGILSMGSGNGSFDHVIEENEDSSPGISTILIETFDLEG